MPNYAVANPVTVTKSNIIDYMACCYGTPRTTAVRIQHQVDCLPQSYTDISAALKIYRIPAWRFQALEKLNIF